MLLSSFEPSTYEKCPISPFLAPSLSFHWLTSLRWNVIQKVLSLPKDLSFVLCLSVRESTKEGGGKTSSSLIYRPYHTYSLIVRAQSIEKTKTWNKTKENESILVYTLHLRRGRYEKRNWNAISFHAVHNKEERWKKKKKKRERERKIKTFSFCLFVFSLAFKLKRITQQIPFFFNVVTKWKKRGFLFVFKTPFSSTMIIIIIKLKMKIMIFWAGKTNYFLL